MKKEANAFLLTPNYFLLTGYQLEGDLDVIRIKQPIHVAGTKKPNMGGGGNVGSDIEGLWNLAGVGAVYEISLQGYPRWSAIV